MKILESAPSRYDQGIYILTLGKLDKVYDRLTSHIKKGQTILDLGCGTGALSLRAAQKGAKVKGIDINAQMLEIAQKQVIKKNLLQNINLCEMGVAELETEKSDSYDMVMSGLCFSELSEDESIFTLKEVKRLLKPGGSLHVADEVRPKNILKRILNGIVKFPLVIITYIITQTTIHSIENLPEKIKESGLLIESVRLNNMENFIEVVAKNPK
ncbi:class I SAM-dependent methyltransferase [Candidatus Atribacteria bacterium 1244-E10-H5-B2]|nr:MAG: class I SAM-dependent methyltransferase [Candidatus Atribacteria bacterium 1244-E10-H5-B2]